MKLVEVEKADGIVIYVNPEHVRVVTPYSTNLCALSLEGEWIYVKGTPREIALRLLEGAPRCEG